ncbi:sugar O-acetyltransferase [Alloscardovia venturai]|uniref:Acetyltransferase n=1 Tax=Alloscardovia venturai TaxID=1769421 RepID=A0ABW2Y3R3_9BIFI
MTKTRETENQEERMHAALPYIADRDGLPEQRIECKKKIYKLNNLHPDDMNQVNRLLQEIFGTADDTTWVEAPFHCDYGTNIHVGKNFFANYNATILDVGDVTIGDNVMFAPNVSIYTAGHPVHPDSRNSGYEYGIPVTIGDNVWIGGNVVILPGVTIGSNVVIGGGSVVTHDIPDWTIAAGNPARVVRNITEEDRDYYFKKRKFDVEDYK